MQSLKDWVNTRERGAILGSVRLTPPQRDKSPKEPYLYCSPGWSLNLTKKQVHVMLCKRRLCENCSWYWAWKWRKALKEKSINDKHFGKEIPDKALTLTFAENVPFRKVQRILEWFWENIRRAYPSVQYWGAVEFNQLHTLPHLHFVLGSVPYIELDYLDYAWQAAQKRAGLSKIAWNLRIEKIRKNVEAYFTKYITKLVGGKDEIPRRENWGGRYIRYSRGFFPIPVAAIMAAAPYNKLLETAESFDRFVFRVRQPLQGTFSWWVDQLRIESKLAEIRAAGWVPERDIAAGVEVPPDDLFTGIGTIAVFDTTIDLALWSRWERLKFAESGCGMGPAF